MLSEVTRKGSTANNHMETAFFQLMDLSLNLDWFLTNQMVLRILIKEAWITTLHCGDHLLSQSFQISSIEEKWRLRSIASENQVQILIEKVHSKNKWKDVSTCLWHKLHMEGKLQPLMHVMWNWILYMIDEIQSDCIF
jgi:hypothetical protein